MAAMARAIRVAREPVGTPIDSVTLASDDRFRRRIRMTTDGGLSFLLDLEEAVALADGDGLVLEDGGWVLVRAADEPVCDISGRDAPHLARIAWHLGNRHLPVQITANRLRIRDDHVIVAMLEGLGATVRRQRAPFHPESGAYGHRHD